jgi:hypothetical protein
LGKTHLSISMIECSARIGMMFSGSRDADKRPFDQVGRLSRATTALVIRSQR